MLRVPVWLVLLQLFAVRNLLIGEGMTTILARAKAYVFESFVIWET